MTYTVVDALGRTVRFTYPLRRLVSLVPSLTEVLCHFGWGPQLVGITDYCTEPAAEVRQKTTVGGTKNPSLPTVLALQPDLVFAVAEENRRQDVAQLEAAGVPVYVFAPTTVRHGIDVLWSMATLLDCRTAVATHIETIEHIYTETLALAATRPRVRVFCPIWKDPYMTISDGTYIHDMLRVCGGDNIFAQRRRRFPLAADLGQHTERAGDRYAAYDRRYPRLALAEMAVLQPEVIVLPDEPYAFGAADVADFLPFATVPAVRDRRIYCLDGKIVSWYGTRIGQSLKQLRALFSLEAGPPTLL